MPEQPPRKIDLNPPPYDPKHLPEEAYETALRVIVTLRNTAIDLSNYHAANEFARAYIALAEYGDKHNRELEEAQGATTGHTDEAIQQSHGELCRCDACICC